jgi:hypothetical protein
MNVMAVMRRSGRRDGIPERVDRAVRNSARRGRRSDLKCRAGVTEFIIATPIWAAL